MTPTEMSIIRIGPPGWSARTGRCRRIRHRRPPAPRWALLSENFLYEKGIEQCDSFKYLAPWRGTNARGGKVIVNEFGNIPDDHPREHVFACDSIDASNVGRGDVSSSKNNRCRTRP